MKRFRFLLAAWALAILGPFLMIAPLINPELEDPWPAVVIGFLMTAAGGLAIRASRRSKTPDPIASSTSAAESTASSDAPKMRWASNAPETWPILETEADALGGPPALLTLRAAAALKSAFEASSSDLELARLVPNYLLNEGLIEAQFEIADGERRTPVFLYPEAGDDEASHFASVRRALAQRDLEAVYFAPAPLADAEPRVDVAQPLGIDSFDLHQQEPEPGNYSMWWPSAEDSDWRTSGCMADIDRFYQALDGREPWFVGFLLNQLGVIEEARPALLPEDLDVFPASGPEGVILLFSVSAEKGLRLHFHESVEPWIRNGIWKQLATACEDFRGQLDAQGVPDLPATNDESPHEWWQLMKRMLERLQEEGQGIERVGTIPI